MMKTEDRHSVWFCSSCNGIADNASLFVEYFGWIGDGCRWRESTSYTLDVAVILENCPITIPLRYILPSSDYGVYNSHYILYL